MQTFFWIAQSRASGSVNKSRWHSFVIISLFVVVGNKRLNFAPSNSFTIPFPVRKWTFLSTLSESTQPNSFKKYRWKNNIYKCNPIKIKINEDSNHFFSHRSIVFFNFFLLNLSRHNFSCSILSKENWIYIFFRFYSPSTLWPDSYGRSVHLYIFNTIRTYNEVHTIFWVNKMY